MAKVNTLTAEIEKYKECTGKSTSELEDLMTKSNCLEVWFVFQLGPEAYLVAYFWPILYVCTFFICQESHEFQMERVSMLERQIKACRKEKQVNHAWSCMSFLFQFACKSFLPFPTSPKLVQPWGQFSGVVLGLMLFLLVKVWLTLG